MTQHPRHLVHTSRQPIRWGDMDALGHVNSTVYFRYMEQARIEWLYSLHPDAQPYQSTGLVIVNASCTFLTPLVYPGEVEVRMYLCDVGRSSVVSHYDLMMGGTKYAEGVAKIVWIDVATGRSAPLPDAVTAPFAAAAPAPAARTGPLTDLD
ncbi:MAG: thioesterase family protein [Betaproteobacteria bacterium]